MAPRTAIGYTRRMSLSERIVADLKKAMLAKDEVARDTLRMVKSELQKREIELGGELPDAEALAVLQRAVKSRTESIEQYEQAGRTDAAARERSEIAIIEQYLPRQLGEDETRAAVEAIAAELGLSGKKDMGRLMKELRDRHQGEVDMKLASRIAGEVLG